MAAAVALRRLPELRELGNQDAEEIRSVIRSTKRAVRLLAGQSRATVQALTALDERLVELEERLNTTAEEAEDGTENESTGTR